ncbi:hypothetical protein FRC04_001238 [Tulasnella sp. 424]|nr:hypothetical protein FRC04_001238 [Tulasnella sp. 424]
MSSTSPRPNLLPKLKHVAIFSDTGSLVPWLFRELAQGAVRPLASVYVYLPEETNQESGHFLNRMSRTVGERLQALSMSFGTPEQSIDWTLVMTNICSTCPNLRRLDVQGTLGSIDMPLLSGLNNTVGGNIGNWIAPLHAMRKLELFNPPKDFLGHLVGRTGDKSQEIKFNHDAMLQLTHTCPSLRLISGSLKQDPRVLQNSSLIYIRSAGDPGKQVDLAKSRYTEEGVAIKVKLLDQGQSTDYVWELYSVSSVSAARDLWRVFLPHFDELRFANER